LNKDKMSKNKISNYLTILLLSVLILAYSTVLLYSMPSIVLCFGEDGYIAFENSDENNQCIDNDNNFTLPLNNCTDLSDQTDNCQDVPLIYVLSALYLKKDGKIKTANLALGDLTVDPIKAYLKSKIEIRSNYNIIHTSMKSLQATILLI